MEWRIAVIPIDGVGPVVETGPVFTGTNYSFAWSPDGTTIALNDVDNSTTWLLDAAGGAERQANWSVRAGNRPPGNA